MQAHKRYVFQSSLVAALGGLLFGFDTAVISGTTEALQSLYQLSDGWLGFTVASALIGTIIGSISVGRPADRIGRRNMLMIMGVLYFVSAVGGVLVLGVGAAMVVNGQLTLGTLVAFLAYIVSFYEPLRRLTDVDNTFQQANAAAERIFELLDEEPEGSSRGERMFAGIAVLLEYLVGVVVRSQHGDAVVRACGVGIEDAAHVVARQAAAERDGVVGVVRVALLVHGRRVHVECFVVLELELAVVQVGVGRNEHLGHGVDKADRLSLRDVGLHEGGARAFLGDHEVARTGGFRARGDVQDLDRLLGIMQGMVVFKRCFIGTRYTIGVPWACIPGAGHDGRLLDLHA